MISQDIKRLEQNQFTFQEDFQTIKHHYSNFKYINTDESNDKDAVGSAAVYDSKK